jgi:hypothetical protein
MSEKKDKNEKGKLHGLRKRAVEFYEHYTAGLKSGDFKRLFTEETKGIYSHFSAIGADGDEDNRKKTRKDGRIKRSLQTVRRIFWGFILALSPARRIIYGISFLLFIICAFIIITAPADSALRTDAATVSMYTFIIASFLLALELADKLSAKGELELARELQHSLLPPEDIKLPGLQISRFALTATEVGGDYHDFNYSHGVSSVAVGDVSGHGLASGVVMAMAKSAWNTQLLNKPDAVSCLSAVEAVVKQAGNGRTFMTFLHCQFDLDSNLVEFANAGHIYPLYFNSREKTVEWIETPASFPLGVKQISKFEILQQKLNPGDLIVLVSDGFVESVNNDGECFDYSRLKNAFLNAPIMTPQVVTEHIVREIKKYVGEASTDDDLTLVTIGYKMS